MNNSQNPQMNQPMNQQNWPNQTPQTPPKKGSAKKVIIILLSIFAAIMLIVTAYVIIDNNIGPKATYREEVSKFLTERYDKDFDVKFVKKRNAAVYKQSSCDASTFTYTDGVDPDVIEYVYSFTSRDADRITNYVVYSLNEKTGESKIYESHSAETHNMCGTGTDASKEDASIYGDDARWLEEKKELATKLENYLDNDYNISFGNSGTQIDIKTSKSLEYEVKYNYYSLERTYEYIYNLLKENYQDLSVTITYNSRHSDGGTNSYVDHIYIRATNYGGVSNARNGDVNRYLDDD